MTARRGNVFVISSPSGGGKTTLGEHLLSSMKSVSRSVSMTTRPKRRGEVNGRDYFFVTPKEFKKKLKKNEFIEHAAVFGRYYGTPRSYVQKITARGRDILLLIDVQGARQIRKRLPDSVHIFVLPPSMAELKRRLKKRATDSPGEIKKRLLISKKEIKQAHKFDYIVVNKNLTKALREIKAIIAANTLKT